MKDIPPQEARQGRRGKQVLNILIISLILAIIVWVGVEFYGSVLSKQENTIEQNQPPPVSRQNP